MLCGSITADCKIICRRTDKIICPDDSCDIDDGIYEPWKLKNNMTPYEKEIEKERSACERSIAEAIVDFLENKHRTQSRVIGLLEIQRIIRAGLESHNRHIELKAKPSYYDTIRIPFPNP